MFDIIVDFPDSKAAIEDLKEWLDEHKFLFILHSEYY